LPLMQLYDPFYSPAVTTTGGGAGTAATAAAAAAAAATRPPLPSSSSSSSEGVLRFSVTVSSVAFEAGSLEAVEGTLSLVDIGVNSFSASHGARRRLSEDMHFRWPPTPAGGWGGANGNGAGGVNGDVSGGGGGDKEAGAGAGGGAGGGGGSSGCAPITGVFTLPARAATQSVRALIQLTHLTPAAGGLDPKVYTHKDHKKVAAHLVKVGRCTLTPPAP
jgi:hypothetical protein